MNSSLKSRAIRASILLAGAVASAGCLKFEQKATIQKDGSGSLSQTISVDLDAWKSLQEFAKAFSPGGMPGGMPGGGGEAKPESDEPTLPFNLSEIQAKAKKVPGLQIRNAKEEHRYIMNFDAVFASWGTLGDANLFAGSAELVKNPDGTYTFVLDMTAGQSGKMSGGSEPGADAGGMGMDPSMIMGLLEPMIGSLEFKQSLTLPTEIVETNGTKGEDGKTVTWKVGFKDITANKGANFMKVTFKGDGLDLKPFKYAPDTAALMERVQGKKPAKEGPTTTPGTGPEAPKAPAMDGK